MMKKILIALTILIGTTCIAQDSTQVVEAIAPKIVSKLEFGQLVKINDYELKFVKVISDSRCPKNVTCVWAGEVTVLVEVYNKGKLVDQKRLNFGRASYTNRTLLNLISTETYKVAGFNVLPYPSDGTKLKEEEYYIQLELIN